MSTIEVYATNQEGDKIPSELCEREDLDNSLALANFVLVTTDTPKVSSIFLPTHDTYTFRKIYEHYSKKLPESKDIVVDRAKYHIADYVIDIMSRVAELRGGGYGAILGTDVGATMGSWTYAAAGGLVGLITGKKVSPPLTKSLCERELRKGL